MAKRIASFEDSNPESEPMFINCVQAGFCPRFGLLGRRRDSV